MSDKPETLQAAPIRVGKFSARDLLERLVRLKNMAKVLQDEIDGLTVMYVTMLQEEQQARRPQAPAVGGVPFSPASSAGGDVEAMIRNLEAAQGGSSNLDEVTSADTLVLFPFSGPQGLLVRWLNADAIDGGVGPVGENEILKQYDEDLSTADMSRLFLWPSGFYRNRVTMERQLLLKTEDRSMIFYFEGLPSNNPVCWAYINDGVVVQKVAIARSGDAPPQTTEIPRLGQIKRKCEEIFNAIASTVPASVTDVSKATRPAEPEA
jgi:hypothetical protein